MFFSKIEFWSCYLKKGGGVGIVWLDIGILVVGGRENWY